MTASDRIKHWETLNELGAGEVRRLLALEVWSQEKRKVAREWLAHQESSQASSDNAAMIEEARSANAIARDAASSARTSADEARLSNNTARTALKVAAIAAVAAIIAAAASITAAVHSYNSGGSNGGQTTTQTKTDRF